MSPFMTFLILAAVLILLVLAVIYVLLTPGVRKTHFLQVSLLVIVFTSALYALIFVSDNRQQVMSHWQAQINHALLASDVLEGKRIKPDDSFFKGKNGSLSEDELSKRTEGLVHALQVQTHIHSENANYWKNLAGIYRQLDDAASAQKSLEKAYHLAPDDMDIAMRYAQVSFMVNEGKLTEMSRAAVAKVLRKNPSHEGAHMLMGMAYIREGDLLKARQAVDQLKYLLTKRFGKDPTDEGSAEIKRLDQLLVMLAQQESVRLRYLGKGVTVQVTLSKKLKLKKQQHATLYITLKPKVGTAYAVKALSYDLNDFSESPLEVTLTDDDHLLTSRTISKAKRDRIALFLVAHISYSGNAIAQPGDWVSEPVRVVFKNGGKPFKLLINQIK